MRPYRVLMRCTLCALVAAIGLLVVTGNVSAQSRGPTITSVDRVNVGQGELVVLNGTGFGSAPGAHGGRWVSLAPVLADVSGNFSPASPACLVPIVAWSTTQIVILIADCPPGEYRVAIRDSNAHDMVNARESNALPLFVVPTTPPPPARQGAQTPPGSIARIDIVHPALASRGQPIDVYGFFPNPVPSYNRIILKPISESIASTPPLVLSPLPGEMLTSHMRVRIPDNDLAAGVYMLIPVTSDGARGSGARVVIRSTEPADWEFQSADRRGAVVDFRLVQIVKHIGQDIDVLGLNLGDTPGPRRLMLFTPTAFRALEQCLADELPLTRLPIVPSLETCARASEAHRIISWSNTRIRIRADGLSGAFLVFIWNNTHFEDSQDLFRQRSNGLIVDLP